MRSIPDMPREDMPRETDVIVIGAGAAGLSAAAELARAGLGVTILEARERVGGRIFTLRDPVCHAPVELGAEFIHGRPPEIWNLLRRRKVRISEVDGDSWCLIDGRLSLCDFFSDINHVLDKMDDRKCDQSFMEFIDDCCPQSSNQRQQQTRERAIRYVSGFNAADPAMVGVHWLVKGMRAEEEIEGDRAFRAERGYAALIDIFQHQLDESGVSVQTSTVVDSIQWRPGHVELSMHGPSGADAQLALARPVENTLFFAGEATDTGGHNGTVQGAIASGRRAAIEITKAAATGKPMGRPSKRKPRKLPVQHR